MIVASGPLVCDYGIQRRRSLKEGGFLCDNSSCIKEDSFPLVMVSLDLSENGIRNYCSSNCS